MDESQTHWRMTHNPWRYCLPYLFGKTAPGDVRRHCLMSEASVSSDYVRVKHPNGIGVDRVEHDFFATSECGPIPGENGTQ